MNVLVINCGSSTIKLQIIAVDDTTIANSSETIIVKGIIDGVGGQSVVTMTDENGNETKEILPLKNHAHAIDFFLKQLLGKSKEKPAILQSLCDIQAVGHRVVHGGEKFTSSCRIDEIVIKNIEDCSELAPLHNPANLKGILATKTLLGTKIPHVAVFDTAFHATLPEVNYLYPVPYSYYRRFQIRKYGFHGTSHRYIAYRYRVMKNLDKSKVNIITMHLGNGSSLCAIQKGKSVNTTMGFTPTAGLMMGTRAGDVDHSILQHLMNKEGLHIQDVENLLNKSSGLLGISGLTHDMRELLEEKNTYDDRRARLAIEMFCARIKGFLGSYLAELNGADAIAISGGIGENSAEIRSMIFQNLENLGVVLDSEKNQNKLNGTEMEISSAESKVKIYVIPTNEELLIARDTFRIAGKDGLVDDAKS